jgi:hypothetical protein
MGKQVSSHIWSKTSPPSFFIFLFE